MQQDEVEWFEGIIREHRQWCEYQIERSESRAVSRFLLGLVLGLTLSQVSSILLGLLS